MSGEEGVYFLLSSPHQPLSSINVDASLLKKKMDLLALTRNRVGWLPTPPHSRTLYIHTPPLSFPCTVAVVGISSFTSDGVFLFDFPFDFCLTVSLLSIRQDDPFRLRVTITSSKAHISSPLMDDFFNPFLLFLFIRTTGLYRRPFSILFDFTCRLHFPLSLYLVFKTRIVFPTRCQHDDVSFEFTPQCVCVDAVSFYFHDNRFSGNTFCSEWNIVFNLKKEKKARDMT